MRNEPRAGDKQIESVRSLEKKVLPMSLKKLSKKNANHRADQRVFVLFVFVLGLSR